MTCNVAEYTAVLEALRWAWQHTKGDELELRTDSKLVVEQVNGRWACNSEGLLPLLARARKGVELTGATIAWVPRTENGWADNLSRIAYRKARDTARVPFKVVSDGPNRAPPAGA